MGRGDEFGGLAHLLGSDRLDTLHGAVDVWHLIPVEHALASAQCGSLHTLRCHEQLAAILALFQVESSAVSCIVLPTPML